MNLVIMSVKTFEGHCNNSRIIYDNSQILPTETQLKASRFLLWPNLCPHVKPSSPAKRTIWKIFAEKHLNFRVNTAFDSLFNGHDNVSYFKTLQWGMAEDWSLSGFQKYSLGERQSLGGSLSLGQVGKTLCPVVS